MPLNRLEIFMLDLNFWLVTIPLAGLAVGCAVVALGAYFYDKQQDD